MSYLPFLRVLLATHTFLYMGVSFSDEYLALVASARLLLVSREHAGRERVGVDGVTASRHGLRELVLRDRVMASVSRREDLEEPRGDKHRAIRDSGLLEY